MTGVGSAAALSRAMWSWPRIAYGAGLAERLAGRTHGKQLSAIGPGDAVRILPALRYRHVNTARLSHYSLTRWGWSARLRLRPGDTLRSVAEVADVLRPALHAEVVAVRPFAPGVVTLHVLRRDPLARMVPGMPVALSSTAVVLGRVDDGRPWVLDLRRMPHVLAAGMTGAGKSTILTGLVVGLAPTDAVLIGIDCKFGIELGPLASRLTRLATDQGEAVELLEEILDLIRVRAAVVRARGVRSVYDLPDGDPAARPVVVLVDEVAELLTVTDDAAVAKRLGTLLVRVASIGRAAGVHLVVAGQRFAVEIAPQLSSLRAQCAGRIVGRCDRDTGVMAIGRELPDALDAATVITLPGVMVVVDGPEWLRVRATFVETTTAAEIANAHAGRAASWSDVIAPLRAA